MYEIIVTTTRIKGNGTHFRQVLYHGLTISGKDEQEV
jgi:hypothetical protein